VPDTATRHKIAKEVEEKGLSVRQVETLTSPGGSPRRPTARRRSHPALEVWEERLRDRFGTQVRIVGGLARGRIEIHYFNEEDLERVLGLAGTATDL
jgi:ParB family chromosome partitioning protein